MKRSTLFASVLALALASSFELSASAQSVPAVATAGSQAETLYKEAVALFRNNDVHGACTKLDESFKLEPATQTLFALAKCRHREGRVATAATQFLELENRAVRSGDAAKVEEMRAKLEEVRALVPHAKLELDAHPEVAEVKVDGQPLPRSDWAAPLPLDPGEHVFVFSGQGKRDAEKKVTLAEKQTLSIQFDPLADSTSVAPVDAPAPSVGAETPSHRGDGSNRTLVYVLGGVGVAGIVVGSITGILAINHKSDADDLFAKRDPSFKDSDDAASTTALVSTIAFGVGIVGLGAAAYFFFTGGSKASAAKAMQFGRF